MSSRYGGRDARDAPLECKVYVGDLPHDATEGELERAFRDYGHLRSVWVARKPAGFAFIEFDDPRDADDAVRGLDGATICGERVRVEHSTGKIRPKGRMRGGPPRGGGGGGGGGGRGRGFNPNDRCYQCGERGHYAYDCRNRGHSGGGAGGGGSRNYGGGSRRRSHSRSRSRSRYRSYSRSKSRSPGRGRYRSGSRSPKRARGDSRSPVRSKPRYRSGSRSPARYSRSRSGSPFRNGRD